jgi:hypothetical protein
VDGGEGRPPRWVGLVTLIVVLTLVCVGCLAASVAPLDIV